MVSVSCVTVMIPIVQQLLISIGVDPSDLSVKPHTVSGNNRTYLAKTSEGCWLVKEYFKDPSQSVCMRLRAECTFLQYAQQVAPQWVPAIYAQDEVAGLALYEFVEGNAVTVVEPAVMKEAQAFFAALNENRQHAVHLPIAAEACWSVDAHMTLIEGRLHRLRQEAAGQAVQALVTQLFAVWNELVESIRQTASAWSLDCSRSLPTSQRCISPSDFGFHNVLRRASGRLCFVDFEYAGWDDPAKMVGDFFSQLAVPVPIQYFDQWIDETMRFFDDPVSLMQRSRLLRPLYQVKWCCIALNVFLPTVLARRLFADPELNVVELQQKQLEKAQQLMKQISWEWVKNGVY